MTTKKALIREAILARLDVHERDGTLPTTSRFIFYEWEARGLATKPPPDDGRPNRRRNIGWPPGSQDITDELTALRDEGVIPWSWVADTERTAVVFTHAATVLDYVPLPTPGIDPDIGSSAHWRASSGRKDPSPESETSTSACLVIGVRADYDRNRVAR